MRGRRRVPAGPEVWVVCREMIPVGSVFAFLAEHRRVLFPPRAFADMYAKVNGRPSVPPGLLATVVVLQALHGLSDEEAVGALRFDLRWKAACGLGLYDQGFDPSLLTYFRRRLARSGDPDRIYRRCAPWWSRPVLELAPGQSGGAYFGTHKVRAAGLSLTPFKVRPIGE